MALLGTYIFISAPIREFVFKQTDELTDIILFILKYLFTISHRIIVQLDVYNYTLYFEHIVCSLLLDWLVKFE